MAEVLVVDDDEVLAHLVVKYLAGAGHSPHRVANGFAALERLENRRPDVVILDLMMPGIHGLEVCREIRTRWPGLPVVVLTALADTDERIHGLESGADDYVTKPVSLRELLLRVEGLLRRTRPVVPAMLRAGGVEVDTARRQVTCRGATVEVTDKEFDLLEFLMTHPGRAFNREQLMDEVWGTRFGNPSTVTVHVRRLRLKLEADAARPELIQTVFGVGYRLEAGGAA